VSVARGPFVMPSSSFALRAPEEEWRKFWSKRAAARLERPDGADQAARPEAEGDLQIFMANLRYFKEALAKLRAGAPKQGRGMSARLRADHRPLHASRSVRAHTPHLCRAGRRGTPLLCLHTAGADGRQYRR